ncbi:hypothetical protein [Virgibacillus salinus]|uniref:Uncharacterized protein n=1 Tax=Virgibacillus salinus TaxID=553311 RepID=A0A1H1GH15_9BACI|nr:hypothetical protein [Virgibacillus salinus]SDR12490.1 hypothetical protein SAMN05216231_3721 [Virgibacillus salinus]
MEIDFSSLEETMDRMGIKLIILGIPLIKMIVIAAFLYGVNQMFMVIYY